MRFEVRYSVTHPPRLWGRGGSSTQQSKSEKKSRENVFSLSSSLLRLLLRWRVFIESFHRKELSSLVENILSEKREQRRRRGERIERERESGAKRARASEREAREGEYF